MGLVNKKEAILMLKKGKPVALPTETVYGLAAPINNLEGLKKIFEIKKRPLNDPLIVHVSSLTMASKLIKNTSDDFKTLADTFWPGPLTLVYKKNKKEVSNIITSNLDSVAIRCPDSSLFLEIIQEVGPLAAPSANIFKAISPTKTSHVLDELPEAYVLEGETSKIGIESTIYDIESQTVLRPGAISAKEISKVLNKKVTYSEKLMTPGSEEDHYQPKQELWVFESTELLNKHLETEHKLMPYRENPTEAAKHLYQDLRDCDKSKTLIFCLFKKTWKDKEEWNAFENRLKKASNKWFS